MPGKGIISIFGNPISKKQDMTSKPKISIITVVYNSKDYIEKTIQSIKEQTYSNIEYIVIDGASTDGTLGLIKKHEPIISQLISEPDNGLYDAMNKGLTAATGEYVWFINSGDLIYSKQTLEKIFDNQDELSDIYYGETMVIDQQGNEIAMRRHQSPEILNWKSFRQGMLVSHQSIIVKRELTSPYDLKYRCSSDFDWVIKLLIKARTIKNTHLILSKMSQGGHTRDNLLAGLKERFWIMVRNYGFIPTVLRHIPITFRFLYYFLKNKRF
jgi:glycosyltransferase involved in cell wall biosynthesis